jgi:hypothetical protein
MTTERANGMTDVMTATIETLTAEVRVLQLGPLRPRDLIVRKPPSANTTTTGGTKT